MYSEYGTVKKPDVCVWCMLVIPGSGKHKKKDKEFEASVSSIMNLRPA